jgi:hypothetical protein
MLLLQWWTATPLFKTTPLAPRWRPALTLERVGAYALWWTCLLSRSSEWVGAGVQQQALAGVHRSLNLVVVLKCWLEQRGGRLRACDAT